MRELEVKAVAAIKAVRELLDAAEAWLEERGESAIATPISPEHLESMHQRIGKMMGIVEVAEASAKLCKSNLPFRYTIDQFRELAFALCTRGAMVASEEQQEQFEALLGRYMSTLTPGQIVAIDKTRGAYRQRRG